VTSIDYVQPPVDAPDTRKGVNMKSRKTTSRSRRTFVGLICAVSLATVGGPLVMASGASAAPRVTTACPASAGDARLVRQIYLQILGRCPGGSESAYWVGRLGAGMARGAFAEAVDVSHENMVNNNVNPGFQGILGRAPTAAELTRWVRNIRNHHGDAVFGATLESSDEHYGHVAGADAAAKDQAWLTEAYMQILDRAPDAAGRAHFTAQLGSPSTPATRLKVALRLEISGENARDWVGAVYGAAFGRGPDPAGMQFWVNWLLGPGHFQTFRMWTTFLSSNEGYALAQTQPNPGAGATAARSLNQLRG
jgi:hypothetical protein